jgi:hypothetical protein
MKISIFIFGILLIGYISYTEEILNENPNEISNYYKEKINENRIKPLSILKTENEEDYNIIIGFLPDNETIENYYYEKGLNLSFNGNTNRQITIDENGILILPEHTTVNIEYSIYYYEIFFNKYSSMRDDPTGKCFSVLFRDNSIEKRFLQR